MSLPQGRKEKMSISSSMQRSRSRSRSRSSSSFLGLRCGCKDSKSVSVSVSSSSDIKSTTPTPTRRRARELSSTDTLTITSPSTSSYWEEEEEEEGAAKWASSPSFSGLLRQLNELEQDVASWGQCARLPVPGSKVEEFKKRRRHRRSRSEGGGRRVEESVAVVKETEDPLGEFRRSMLQMIVEKEILDVEELRELLWRFLALNSPLHHDTILRAFADIWEEVFDGYENTPDDLLHRRI